MGPEGRIPIPESATKPFNTPEVKNAGAVGVLEKPREVEDTYSIGYLPSPIMTEIPIDEKNAIYTSEGEKVGPANVLDKPKELKTPDQVTSTGLHEGWHIATGILRGVGIAGADVKRKGDALGTTYPDSFDGPTAAAGHASGTGGYGYDFSIGRLHGRDPYADSAAATATIKQLPELPIELAWNLDRHKSLGRNDITTIHSDVKEEDKKRNKKTQAYEIPIKTKEGKEETVRLEVPKGATMLHVPLPPSGDIYDAKRDTFYSESSKDF